MLGIGLGLALDVLGVLLLVSSGNAVAGVAVLAISTFIVLGVVLSRGSASGRGDRYAGGGGFGGAWVGGDGSGGGIG